MNKLAYSLGKAAADAAVLPDYDALQQQNQSHYNPAMAAQNPYYGWTPRHHLDQMTDFVRRRAGNSFPSWQRYIDSELPQMESRSDIARGVIHNIRNVREGERWGEGTGAASGPWQIQPASLQTAAQRWLNILNRYTDGVSAQQHPWIGRILSGEVTTTKNLPIDVQRALVWASHYEHPHTRLAEPVPDDRYDLWRRTWYASAPRHQQRYQQYRDAWRRIQEMQQ